MISKEKKHADKLLYSKIPTSADTLEVCAVVEQEHRIRCKQNNI